MSSNFVPLGSEQAVSLQLALQGGGAKIVLLLAAMEAIQSLQEQGVIRVTRIAGTSAGAIVGCAFAAGIRMETVRERLRSVPKDRVLQAFPAKLGSVAQILLLRGRPLWDPLPLETELKRQFEQGAALSTLAEIKDRKGIQVYVIAASLVHSGKVVYDSQPIVPALLDSCGIPLFFRTQARTPDRDRWSAH